MKHVLVIPLDPSIADARRVDFLLKCSGQLKNATLGTMIGRIEQLRRDKHWREQRGEEKSKNRINTYNELKKAYSLSEFDAIRVAQQHARESGWLTDHLDGRVITSIGKEVWTPVSQWLHGQAGKPRFTPAWQRTIFSGNDQRAGLRYKNGYIIHTTKAINQSLRAKEPLGNKLLKIRVDWGSIPKKRRKYYREQVGNIKKVSIVQKGNILEGHLVYDCKPYRHKDKVAQAKKNLNKKVSFDLGPSALAFVAPESKHSGVIQPTTRMRNEIKKERSKRKRIERAMDRSKRVNNPDCYQEDGSYIPGKKIEIRSKNYFELQDRLRSSYNRERKIINDWHQAAVEQLTSLGLELTTEKDTIKQWQEEGYGKSITTSAPAALKGRIFHEAKVLREHHGIGESNTELNTYTTCLSQSCICGNRVKKDLTQRVHKCQNQDCLLYQVPLHRDKFSSLLGYWVKELGTRTDSQGKKSLDQKLGVKRLLNKTYHTQEHRTVAIELCSISTVGSLDHNPGVTPDSMRTFSEKSFTKKVLDQAKTSSRQDQNSVKTIPKSSKPSRLLTKDRDGRVNHLNTTDIKKTDKLAKPSSVESI